MNVLALDCEYNQLNGNPKTIQIGAAVYSAKSGLLLAKFETFVNPHEPIDPFITTLTGITDRDVSNAPDIKEAFLELERLHKKHRCFKNPIVWGSGTRNDSDTIHKEANILDAEGKIVPNFMGHRVIDVKSQFQSIQIFHNEQIRGGLEMVCNNMLKIGFEGKAHTALADAMNTFRVWHYLNKQYSKGFQK